MQLKNDTNDQVLYFIKSYFSNTNFNIKKLLGDAGDRDYYRVSTREKNYILAKYSSDKQSIKRFIEIGDYLNKIGLNAPDIYYSDLKLGLILMEDFGNQTINKKLESSNLEQQNVIYKKLIDLLCFLRKELPPLLLPKLTDKTLINELNIFIDYYLPYKYKKSISVAQKEELYKILQEIFSKKHLFSNVISLQDYHVDNIMLLDNKDSLRSLGLLDFQDAKLACPVYDLVSILQDARIKVKQDRANYLLKYYSRQSGDDIENIMTNYNILGMQRNSRILGVFSKKFIADNNKEYLHYIPLVEEYLRFNLKSPIMSKLKNWLDKL
ncbi:MAG TPA: phosphotransferase [Candidatus Megaira endosymbiont of Nemacystus decipiens]|nr:phosphotransferase [Candidatus Megaera endosymbiont of Nemacystus decipiens]